MTIYYFGIFILFYEQNFFREKSWICFESVDLNSYKIRYWQVQDRAVYKNISFCLQFLIQVFLKLFQIYARKLK